MSDGPPSGLPLMNYFPHIAVVMIGEQRNQVNAILQYAGQHTMALLHFSSHVFTLQQDIMQFPMFMINRTP